MLQKRHALKGKAIERVVFNAITKNSILEAIAHPREIHEELDCRIEVGGEVTTTTHDYEFATVTLATFYCRLVAGAPRATEHEAIAWLPPAELGTLTWAPADVPAVELLQETLPEKEFE